MLGKTIGGIAAAALAVAGILVAGPGSGVATATTPCGTEFSCSTVNSTDNASEPGVLFDQKSGDLFVNAPVGLPGPSRIYRSTDGGTSWTGVTPPNVGVGVPPSATVGGGDSNLAVDAGGNLYFVDLWLGSYSTAVSSDHGNTWTGVPFGTVVAQDRPWVAADPRPGHTGIAYTVTEQIPTGLWLSMANIPAAGATLPLSGSVYPVSILEESNPSRGIIGADPPGNIVTGQNGATYNVYSTTGGMGMSVLPSGWPSSSNVLPVSETVTPANGDDVSTGGFPVVAVDNTSDNNVYVVWTQPTPTSWNIRFASSSDGGQTWTPAVTLGQGVYPWLTADAPGKVDVAWYSAVPASSYPGDPNNAPAGTKWDVVFSQITNALATPSVTGPTIVDTAVKPGPICTQGTTCSSDRELGDFMSIDHDSAGNALIAYVRVPSAGTSDVEFAKQTTGTTIG